MTRHKTSAWSANSGAVRSSLAIRRPRLFAPAPPAQRGGRCLEINCADKVLSGNPDRCGVRRASCCYRPLLNSSRKRLTHVHRPI